MIEFTQTILGLIGFVALLVVILVGWVISWFTIVSPSEAHLVVTPNKKFVACADEAIGEKRSYYAIPSWIPGFGRKVKVMDITIKDLTMIHETVEKNQARYNVKSSTKYRIRDVKTASETYINDTELHEQLSGILHSAIRAVTIRYDIQEARAQKAKMATEVEKEIEKDFSTYGTQICSFQLVDIQDTADSKIISNISRRREVEIESETRQVNAEKMKQAVMKEAESTEASKKREIERDESIAKREQDKVMAVAVQEKLARDKQMDVVKISTIRQAEIDKEKAIVKANQDAETQKIIKEQQRLIGEGTRMKMEQEALGDYAKTFQAGKANADAKELLQKALQKFDDNAIRALVAEKIVDMQTQVGVKSAEALKEAELKIFVGGNSAGQGFDLGQLISSMAVSNKGTADAVLNLLARPNDLGLGDIKKMMPSMQPATIREVDKKAK